MIQPPKARVRRIYPGGGRVVLVVSRRYRGVRAGLCLVRAGSRDYQAARTVRLDLVFFRNCLSPS